MKTTGKHSPTRFPGKLTRTLACALALTALMGASTAASATDTGALAYYGDRNNARVFALDPRSMTVRTIIQTVGQAPYPVDGVSGSQVYVSTRNSEALEIIQNGSSINGFIPTWAGVIPLQHTPRSVTFNKTRNLAAVSGGNRVMTTIIDSTTGTVVGVVGNAKLATQTRDYGGALATGHPFWVDADRFLMLDRVKRKVTMYRINANNQIFNEGSVNTPTAVHHFHSMADTDGLKLYAAAEGSPANGIAPAVLEFVLEPQNGGAYELVLNRTTPLSGFDPATMGAHHLDLCPNGDHLLIGSIEGHLFSVNRHTMQIEEVLNAGKGTGHTIFNVDRGLAVVVNHTDTFLTIIQAPMMSPGTPHNHPVIATVSDISPPQVTAGQNTQSHTSSFDPGSAGRYFYTMASDNGSFVRIDMDTYTVSDRLMLSPGGYPIQGTYVWPVGTTSP